MHFALESTSTSSGRLGSIKKTGGYCVQTPLLLQYTRAGSIPYLSKESYEFIENEQKAVEICVETTFPMAESLKTFQKGISAFTGLDDHITFVTLRDSGITNQWFHSRTDVALFSKKGKISVSPQQFVSLLEGLRPDIFHTLCDGDTSEGCAKKRVFNAVERTKSFFEECLKISATSEVLKETILIAPVEGGYDESAREEYIKYLQQFETQIGGYFLDGFHSGGDSATNVNTEKVKTIVSKCISQLKDDKIRCMLGAYSPLLITELVQLGVDVFDSTFAYLATQSNQALVFNFDLKETVSTTSSLCIELSNPVYKDDFQPYVANCKCLACQKHTRAYTHHLINTKELLGPILLMIHNTHHFLGFFDSIRKSLAADTLPNLIALIAGQSSVSDIK